MVVSSAGRSFSGDVADTARARDTLQGLLDSFPEAKTGFSLACYFHLVAMLSPIRAKLPKAAQLRFSTNA